jgi:hypothetical protein
MLAGGESWSGFTLCSDRSVTSVLLLLLLLLHILYMQVLARWCGLMDGSLCSCPVLAWLPANSLYRLCQGLPPRLWTNRKKAGDMRVTNWLQVSTSPANANNPPSCTENCFHAHSKQRKHQAGCCTCHVGAAAGMQHNALYKSHSTLQVCKLAVAYQWCSRHKQRSGPRSVRGSALAC